MRKFSQIEKFEYLVQYEDNAIKKLSEKLSDFHYGSYSDFCISKGCDDCIFFKTLRRMCPKDFEKYDKSDWDEFLEKYPEYKIII